MNTEYCLNFFKARDVKSPAKFGEAAGWDFYIPNDLTIFDFTTKLDTYINEFSILPSSKNIWLIPLEFGITIDNKFNIYMISVLKESENILTPKIIVKPNDLLKVFSDNIESVSNEVLEKLLITPVDYVKIFPGSKILIPSGIHVNLPSNIFLNAENKSGIASKRGLVHGASLIDPDYEGQIHINLINPTTLDVIVKPGEKIIQFVPYFKPIMNTSLEYKFKEDLYKNSKSVRGAGGFGSSGIN